MGRTKGQSHSTKGKFFLAARAAAGTPLVIIQRDDKWEKVDWQLNDCTIALDLGLTRERVRQVRRDLGRDKVKKLNTRAWINQKRDAEIIRLAKAGKNAPKIASMLGISKWIVIRVCKEAKVSTLSLTKRWSPPDWALAVDWSKPIKQIASENGVSRIWVVFIKKRLGLSKPNSLLAKADWSKVDWNKPSHQIAAEVGVSVATVRNNIPLDISSLSI